MTNVEVVCQSINSTLRILYLEDDAGDAELIQETLATDGVRCELVRVDTESDFVAALEPGGFDLIFADYTLPSFDGLSALKIVRKNWPHLPFIFVSATLGEELAIEAVKIGAAEHVLKTRLFRLAPAVRCALREAQERMTLEKLTASIAHEINQPLAGIISNAQASLRWLNRDSPQLHEACESIRCIIRDGKRASEVVAGIRALFIRAPKTKERFYINEAIAEALMFSEGKLQQNRVVLKTELANDLPLVMGDRIQLQQVMLNLLSNAIEAMSGLTGGSRELWVSSQRITGIPGKPEKGQLKDTVSSDVEQTRVLITVRDSGPGLDQRALGRCFDAFYTTKTKGMGMGLAISRSIIEAAGGRLWAMPNAPRGAAFQFTLPIEIAPADLHWPH
jgi:signal transduction histidine kinase